MRDRLAERGRNRVSGKRFDTRLAMRKEKYVMEVYFCRSEQRNLGRISCRKYLCRAGFCFLRSCFQIGVCVEGIHTRDGLIVVEYVVMKTSGDCC